MTWDRRDIERRARAIEGSNDLRAARRMCAVLGPPEPLAVKLDRLRLAGIENRRMEGRPGARKTKTGSA